MHESTRDQLEALLAEGEPATGHGDVSAHLASCSECSFELGVMREQSTLLRSLRAPEELEPTAGFYARVMQRIEEHAKNSIWAGLIYSPFGKRIAYASLSFALVLGLYVFSQERGDEDTARESVVAQQPSTDNPVFGDQSQQRNAVLVNLASY